MKQRKLQLAKKDVWHVARRTVEALKGIGYDHCCLFGSAACSIIGDDKFNRIPHDLDFVVFTDDEPEVIKKRLKYRHDRFFLENGRNGAYKVLWYFLCWSPELKIKVDILTYGKKPLGIPFVPSDAIAIYRDIPVIPFLSLLILKVQGWRDHLVSRKPWYQKKIPQDKADIKSLLSMVDDDDNLRNYVWLEECTWFMKNANMLVKGYVRNFPHSIDTWRSIGFDV